MIYFDEAATTKPSALALSIFDKISKELWYNPSSTMYDGGHRARSIVEIARATIADCVGARPEQIFFTSGSTEAANWIIQGQIPRSREYEWLLAYSTIEHPCVYNAARYMGDCGVLLGKLSVDARGIVDDRDVAWQLSYPYRDKKLFCIMGANNEIGTRQDIKRIAKDIHAVKGAKLMCDMTQSFAHDRFVDVADLDVDYAFASGQKFGAFKGCGFLYVKDPDSLKPFMYGGHQETGLRPGTENVSMISAMAAQFAHVCANRESMWQTLWMSRNEFKRYNLPDGAWMNGGTDVIPNVMSITIPGIDANKLISFLNLDGYYLSAGSACSTGENKPSRILKAIGMTDEDARCTIRIGFNEHSAKHLEELGDKIKYHIEEGLCKLE